MRSYGNPKKNLLQLTRIFTIDILNIGAPADFECTKRFQFRVHVFNFTGRNQQGYCQSHLSIEIPLSHILTKNPCFDVCKMKPQTWEKKMRPPFCLHLFAASCSIKKRLYSCACQCLFLESSCARNWLHRCKKANIRKQSLGGGEKSRWCVWKSQPGPSQWPPPSCSSMASMPGVLETSWKANSERSHSHLINVTVPKGEPF